MNGFNDPKSHPVGALLPRYTFITGPNGVGKTTLAQQLFNSINGLQAFSFAEPIREALLGMFHQGDIALNLTHEQVKRLPIPGFPEHNHRQVLNALGDWMRSYFGEDALGRYAFHRCQLDSEYFDRFVFDDARRVTDLEPILHNCAAKDALLISMERPGVTFDQPGHFRHDDLVRYVRQDLRIRVCELVNDCPIDALLDKLHTTLKNENVIAHQP